MGLVAGNAVVQHMLPSPVLVDLIFRGGGWRSARMVSRGWTILKSLPRLSKVASTSSNFAARSSFGAVLELPGSRNPESFICRANSCGQSGVPEREDAEELRGTGLEEQPEGLGQDAEMQSAPVGAKHGPEGDRFRRSPSPDFSDEFFTRMMALEASRRASPRVSDLHACSAASLNAAGALDSSPPSGVELRTQGALCPLGMGGVQLPPSIKKLRRRNSDVKGESRTLPGCAIRNAFSSMVYMIKVVQSHALRIRQVLFSEWDVQEVLLLVHRELHSSFVWLFQEVFACTPKLMVSVMILLANFTVHSMGQNVAVASVSDTPAPIALFLSTYGNPQASLDPHFSSQPYSPLAPPPHADASGAGFGGNNFSSPSITESFDGDSRLNGAPNHRYMFSQEDSVHSPGLVAEAARRFQESVAPTNIQPSHQEMLKAWVASSLSGEGLVPQLEQDAIRRLVAPVVAHLESDDYACFDRTDLEYQHSLSRDPRNPLLLSNYAQFLYVVRHDNDRAEGCFHQAMQADPMDATILGRFANFLWLGRGNRAAAERAYKAAMAADPENSFPAGNYAHFLWHSGESDSHGASGALAS